MKKEIILKSLLTVLVITSLFSFLSVEGTVLANEYTAQKAIDELCKDPLTCPIKEPGDIIKILEKIVYYTYIIFFIVAVFFIIVAAFNFLTAGDDPEKIKSARNQIFWAVVAIAIALLSVSAETIIKDLLGGAPSSLPLSEWTPTTRT